MKNWILGCALVLITTTAFAGGTLPSDVASRTIVDTCGASPIAQLGMGKTPINFRKFVSQYQTAHPGEVVVKQNGGAFIVKDNEESMLFETKDPDQIVIEKMRVHGQDLDDDKVSASFALLLLNLGAKNNKH